MDGPQTLDIITQAFVIEILASLVAGGILTGASALAARWISNVRTGAGSGLLPGEQEALGFRGSPNEKMVLSHVVIALAASWYVWFALRLWRWTSGSLLRAGLLVLGFLVLMGIGAVLNVRRELLAQGLYTNQAFRAVAVSTLANVVDHCLSILDEADGCDLGRGDTVQCRLLLQDASGEWDALYAEEPHSTTTRHSAMPSGDQYEELAGQAYEVDSTLVQLYDIHTRRHGFLNLQRDEWFERWIVTVPFDVPGDSASPPATTTPAALALGGNFSFDPSLADEVALLLTAYSRSLTELLYLGFNARPINGDGPHLT